MILADWAYPGDDDTTQINELKGVYSNDPNSRLRRSMVKVCVQRDEGIFRAFFSPTLFSFVA